MARRRHPGYPAAVSSSVCVSADLAQASLSLDLVPTLPPLVWGRDEHHTGEMWNWNSVTSWLLSRAGIDARDIRPPPGGRASGWHAGLVVAGGHPDLRDPLTA